MKQYVIITYDIHPIGGTQAYTAGKARYLEKEGWHVVVFFAGLKEGQCAISFLDRYLVGGIRGLAYLPYRIDEDYRELILSQMEQCLPKGAEEIIIESHYDVAAFWGELIAEKVSGRHYVFCCNEYYRTVNNIVKYYDENLDYFAFKYERNELITTDVVIQKLFNGYRNINESKIKYPQLIVEQDPIQDVDNTVIDSIPTDGWNICSIGRLEKPYIKAAIEGVRQLALNYPEQSIHLIIVGNEVPRTAMIEQTVSTVCNLDVIYLGVLVPIPRALFSKVDVVIAAAQTAVFTSYERAYTITANVLNDTTPGVLGYDTQDAWYGGIGKEKSYKEVLEDVLVHRAYDNKAFFMPLRQAAEAHYAMQWEYLALSTRQKEYDVTRFCFSRVKNWIAIFPYWRIKEDEVILIYGAGEVGRDYISQIELTKYCKVSGIVDKNADCFDGSVSNPEEGLLRLNYDTILIAVKSDFNVNDIKYNIEKIVGKKNVVFDLKLQYF